MRKRYIGPPPRVVNRYHQPSVPVAESCKLNHIIPDRCWVHCYAIAIGDDILLHATKPESDRSLRHDTQTPSLAIVICSSSLLTSCRLCLQGAARQEPLPAVWPGGALRLLIPHCGGGHRHRLQHRRREASGDRAQVPPVDGSQSLPITLSPISIHRQGLHPRADRIATAFDI